MSKRNGNLDGGKEQQLRLSSVLPLFIVGGLLIAVPLVLVIDWSSNACSFTVKYFCRSSQLYRTGSEILPYVMLAGGAIVGYNMKRTYDLANPASDDEGEKDGDDETARFPDLR